MPISPVKTVLATENDVAAICDKAREQIYAKVLDHYNRHPGSAWSGHYLVDLEKSIKAMYKHMGVDIGGAFRAGLPKTMREFYDRAATAMVRMGKRNAIVGKPDTGRISFFLNNSFEEIAMRTQKMSADHIRQLREISADVLRTTSLTGATRAQVTKDMLARASEIPGFKFTAANGVVWKDKTYFTMLARTELMKAGRAAYDDKCAAEGCDVMMLDYSGNCCEACGKWEGQLFSLTGATPGLPTKADLEADGVFHPNCTHSYSAVPDYIREKDFNADGSPKESGKNEKNDSAEPAAGDPFAAVKAVHPDAFNGSEVENLDEYARMWESSFKNIPAKLLDGIDAYTLIPGQAINEYLRFGKGKLCDGWEPALLQSWAENTSEIFDTVKNKTNVIVYRCVTDTSFIPGKGSFTDRGFGSCSTRPNLMFGSKILKIQVPKGARGGFIRSVSGQSYENEFLLDKNTKYDILYTKKMKINGEKHDCIVLRVKNEKSDKR